LTPSIDGRPLREYLDEVVRWLERYDVPPTEHRLYFGEPYIWVLIGFDKDAERLRGKGLQFNDVIRWSPYRGWICSRTGPLPVPYLGTPEDVALAIKECVLGLTPTTSAEAEEWEKADAVRFGF